tara:strand:- start:250 stop:1206 length:957 start_codon:yes stop_codon:yes gene_type:complete
METPYCELKKGSKLSCSKTKDASKNSKDCEYKPSTRRCVLKKKTLKKKKSPTVLKSLKIPKSKLKSLSGLKCDNEEDPISISHFKDDKIPLDEIIALPLKGDKKLCFEGETIWNMFANHVGYSYDIFVEASKGKFTEVKALDMSVWGIMEDIMTIDVVKKYLKKRAELGLKKKEFKDPNAPYVKDSNATARHLLENFLSDRIDPNNSIHVEYLTKAILGDHTNAGQNLSAYEWKPLIEITYGTWVAPYSNNVRYLKPLTTKARSDVMGVYDISKSRLIFINLLIDMYNEILKKSSAEEARSKLTMLLWALQLQLQDSM